MPFRIKLSPASCGLANSRTRELAASEKLGSTLTTTTAKSRLAHSSCGFGETEACLRLLEILVLAGTVWGAGLIKEVLRGST